MEKRCISLGVFFAILLFLGIPDFANAHGHGSSGGGGSVGASRGKGGGVSHSGMGVFKGRGSNSDFGLFKRQVGGHWGNPLFNKVWGTHRGNPNAGRGVEASQTIPQTGARAVVRTADHRNDFGVFRASDRGPHVRTHDRHEERAVGVPFWYGSWGSSNGYYMDPNNEEYSTQDEVYGPKAGIEHVPSLLDKLLGQVPIK